MLNHRKKIISLKDLDHNLGVLRNVTNRRIFPVLKGNAYGHGITEVGRRIGIHDNEILCCATLDEALVLKLSRPKARVLFWLHSSIDELRIAILNRIEFSIGSFDQLEKIESISRFMEQETIVHVEIDCGLNRGGFKFFEINDLNVIFARLKSLKNIKIKGVWSHVSNPSYSNRERSQREIQLFSKFLDLLEVGDFLDSSSLDVHLGGSGIVELVEDSRVNSLRVGLSLYGYSYITETQSHSSKMLRVCMGLSAKILYIKQVRVGDFVGYNNSPVESNCEVAVVGLGYGDGVLKNAFFGLAVRNADHEHTVIDNPAMDQLFLDVTGCKKCRPGDWVSIFGPEEIENYGLNYVWKNKFIPNEILSLVGSRVGAVYKD